jgi:acyl-CoA thioesterase
MVKIHDLFGIEVLEVKEGFARVKARVKREFLNIHGTAHGGFIFTLADVAFGLAVNYDSPRMAISINMNFIKPAFEGDELVAEAKVEGGGKRVKFCLLRVYKGDDLIAEGTAIAYGIKKIQ